MDVVIHVLCILKPCHVLFFEQEIIIFGLEIHQLTVQRQELVCFHCSPLI